MTMVSTTYQTIQGYDNSSLVHVFVARFTRSLKEWWDEHLTSLEKQQILEA